MESSLPRNTIALQAALGIDELILRNARLFAFPVAEYEKRAYEEVSLLPPVVVTRPTKESTLSR